MKNSLNLTKSNIYMGTWAMKREKELKSGWLFYLFIFLAYLFDNHYIFMFGNLLVCLYLFFTVRDINIFENALIKINRIDNEKNGILEEEVSLKEKFDFNHFSLYMLPAFLHFISIFIIGVYFIPEVIFHVFIFDIMWLLNVSCTTYFFDYYRRCGGLVFKEDKNETKR